MNSKPKFARAFLPLALFALCLSSFGPGLRSARAEGTGDDAATGGNSPMDWRITGPIGGDVRALVVDPSDQERFYFGTLDGQLYTSTDGGETWRLLYNFNRPGLFIDHIIVDPRDSRTLYVAAHRHKNAGGFFKSTDGGIKWREAKELKAEALHSMTQSSQNPDMIVVGANSGIYRSMDSGDSWRKLDTSAVSGLENVESLAIDPRNPDVVYAGTWYLPYRTRDGGKNWSITKTGIIDDSDIFALDIDPRDPNHIFASACSGIYQSHNAGDSWSKVSGIPSQSRRTRAILQHPSVAGAVYAGTTEGFWRSADGGNSWMLATSKQIEVNSIAVHPRNPQVIHIGTNNYGVMVSRDGGRTFVPSNGGYSGRFAKVLVTDRERDGRIYAATINTATGGGFFFISADGGETWQPSMKNMPNRLITYSILQDRVDANVIYLGTNLGIYRSADRGVSWAPVAAGKTTPAPKGKARAAQPAVPKPAAIPSADSAAGIKAAQIALNAAGYDAGPADGKAGSRTVEAIRKYQTDKGMLGDGKLDDLTLSSLLKVSKVPALMHVSMLNDKINALTYYYDENGAKTGILAATNGGLFRSFDMTRGWDRMTFSTGHDPRTTCVWTAVGQPGEIWVGTATSGVLRSGDGGRTWDQVAGIPAVAPINVIVQDPQRADHMFVGTGQTLFLTTDGGNKWSRRGGDLPVGDFYSILINPNDSNEVYAGSAFERGGGLYRSANGGQTWNRIDPQNAGLPSQRVWALAFDQRNPNRIFVATHSAGIYVVDRRNAVSLKTAVQVK
ncbi:MAG: YCF48-related protein [Pyrinomonadaceae bacterium]